LQITPSKLTACPRGKSPTSHWPQLGEGKGGLFSSTGESSLEKMKRLRRENKETKKGKTSAARQKKRKKGGEGNPAPIFTKGK